MFFFILEGVLVNLKYAVSSVFLGFFLGVLLALIKTGKRLRVLKFLAEIYTTLFRGTPLLVQLALFYYGLPQFGICLSIFQAGLLTFSLNSSAYMCEILRSTIASLDPGYAQCARTLGLSKTQIAMRIVLPLSIRSASGSIMNECVDLIKESSLMATLSEMDLLRRAQVVAAEQFIFFKPYLIAAFGYFMIIYILSALAKKLEKHFAI